MIKIRISYTDDNDLYRVIQALKRFKMLGRSKKPAERNGHKSFYIEIE